MRMPSRTGKVRFRTLTECEFKLTPCFSPAIIPRCFCGEHADNTHRVVSWVVERGIGGLQLTEHCTAIRYCIVEDTRVGWSTVLRHVEDIVGAVQLSCTRLEVSSTHTEVSSLRAPRCDAAA